MFYKFNRNFIETKTTDRDRDREIERGREWGKERDIECI